MRSPLAGRPWLQALLFAALLVGVVKGSWWLTDRAEQACRDAGGQVVDGGFESSPAMGGFIRPQRSLSVPRTGCSK